MLKCLPSLGLVAGVFLLAFAVYAAPCVNNDPLKDPDCYPRGDGSDLCDDTTCCSSPSGCGQPNWGYCASGYDYNETNYLVNPAPGGTGGTKGAAKYLTDSWCNTLYSCQVNNNIGQQCNPYTGCTRTGTGFCYTCGFIPGTGFDINKPVYAYDGCSNKNG